MATNCCASGGVGSVGLSCPAYPEPIHTVLTTARGLLKFPWGFKKIHPFSPRRFRQVLPSK
eukprot:6351022-Amphidinium_carterae.1